MEVFRITKTKWARELSASGYAARWNSNGKFIIYAAESRSLACLENLVHRNGFGYDNDYCVISILIPEKIAKFQINSVDLPVKWNQTNEESIVKCQLIGDNWLRNQKSAVLFVPSSLIANEYNILINPNHQDFQFIKIKKTESFTFDSRL